MSFLVSFLLPTSGSTLCYHPIPALITVYSSNQSIINSELTWLTTRTLQHLHRITPALMRLSVQDRVGSTTLGAVTLPEDRMGMIRHRSRLLCPSAHPLSSHHHLSWAPRPSSYHPALFLPSDLIPSWQGQRSSSGTQPGEPWQ